MPTLHWIGKDKVVNHHQDVPYRVLEYKYGFAANKGEQSESTHSGNKIIYGDNLLLTWQYSCPKPRGMITISTIYL